MEIDQAAAAPSGTAAPTPQGTEAPQAAQQPAASKARSRRRNNPGRQRAASDSAQPAADTDEEQDSDQGAGAGSDVLTSESDEDEMGEGEELQGPPDPFYDPEADDKDEQWLQTKRQGRWSDAILSCPGCFTTLCIDCQQHNKYHHQYRAMFVMNCEVDTDQWVNPSQGAGSSVAGHKRLRPGETAEGATPPAAAPADAEECLYHPVKCEACETQVGVLDPTDGVYILYNVFPSNS